MVAFQNPINYYYLTIVVLDTIYTIIMLWLIFQIIMKGKGTRHVKTITTPLVYFSFSLVFPNLVHIITHLEGIFVVSINVDIFYMLGYAVYSFAWLIGMNYYLNKTIRLAKQIRQRYTFFISFLLLISIVSFITSIIMAFFPELTESLQRTVFLLVFAGLGLGISILFIVFMRTINKERQRNPSKIVKARIDLLTRVLIIQIILGLLFFMLASLVIIFPEYRSLLNLLFFGVTDTLGMISVLFLYWSVEIPDYIRVKYDISPSRFTAIKNA